MNKTDLKNTARDVLTNIPEKQDIIRVSLFGSRVFGEATLSSDLDVLVEFTDDTRIGLFRLVGIKRDLEARLGIPVDLVTPEALSKYFKDAVIKNSELVYER